MVLKRKKRDGWIGYLWNKEQRYDLELFEEQENCDEDLVVAEELLLE